MSEHSAEDDAPECECFWTDPSTWLSAASCGYGGGYEPGSQREWSPDCLAHPADRGPLYCAVVACGRPQGTPHVADCPYFGQDNIGPIPPAAIEETP